MKYTNIMDQEIALNSNKFEIISNEHSAIIINCWGLTFITSSEHNLLLIHREIECLLSHSSIVNGWKFCAPKMCESSAQSKFTATGRQSAHCMKLYQVHISSTDNMRTKLSFTKYN